MQPKENGHLFLYNATKRKWHLDNGGIREIQSVVVLELQTLISTYLKKYL